MTGYELSDRGSGIRFPAGAGNFSLLHRAQTSILSNGYQGPGREADYSPTSGAEVKNAWRYTSTSTPDTSLGRGA
jgi:hypothetical protein